MSDEPRVISVKIPEAVRITGISRSRLYELIRSGDLEIVKLGRSTLIKTTSLQALVDRLTRNVERS